MNDASKLLKNNHCLFLAYDQGFEHGPTDFDDKSVDPKYILSIANDSGAYTGIIFHEGIAQSYYDKAKETVPLIIKVNGKTSLHPDEEPYSPQLCSIDEAIRLGATAVGYTIFIGSSYEGKMMEEFSRIEDEAHTKNLAVILWAYPRGKNVTGREKDKDIVAYGARIALEMGADFVKIPYTGSVESVQWIVKSAGTTHVIVQGGAKVDEQTILDEAIVCKKAGATGMAIGRNIWQSQDPIGISKKLATVMYEN
jgi:class I fructose-bisphosphate aldolase